MASITTRAGKGSPLTNAEVDANFTNINTELGQKLVASDLSPYLLSATAASTYLPRTGGTLTGNLAFSGNGLRITGDFSGGVTSRLMFQTSTANGQTLVTAIPSGTAVNAQFQAYNSSDPSNSSIGSLVASASQVRIVSGSIGTGTVNPITFIFSNTEAARFDPTTRNFLIGTSTDNATDKLQVNGTIKSLAGGYVFPDGTTQTTAATVTSQQLSDVEALALAGL